MTKIKFIGSIRKSIGQKEIELTIDGATDIKSLLIGLSEANSAFKPNFTKLLSTTLILIDGVEIGNLSGLESKVANSAEIVLIPVAHGG